MIGEHDLTASVERRFADRFGHVPSGLARAPGRVNLIGEHVDYNDGWVLPAAIERSVVLAFEPTAEPVMDLTAADLGLSMRIPLGEVTGGMPPRKLPAWVRYPAGVAWALLEAGHEVRGLRGVYASSIPIGAGLSSSAAVEAVFALAWQSAGGWPASPMDLARLCQHAENDFVGVHCGLMDQFASLHGARGQALLFDCRLLTWEGVPVPPEGAIVVADSGVGRHLGASAYNQRRAECEQALHVLQQRIPGIRALRDVTPEMFAENAGVLPDLIRRRAQHVVDECLRPRLMADALLAADLPRAGELLNASHASLRSLYDVSGPELEMLVEAARRQPGCFGARLTGAGFGGCTVQLVEATQAAEFGQSLADAYQRASGRRAEVMVTAAAQGAQVLRPPA